MAFELVKPQSDYDFERSEKEIKYSWNREIGSKAQSIKSVCIRKIIQCGFFFFFFRWMPEEGETKELLKSEVEKEFGAEC